jgi:hypothetical protein
MLGTGEGLETLNVWRENLLSQHSQPFVFTTDHSPMVTFRASRRPT